MKKRTVSTRNIWNLSPSRTMRSSVLLLLLSFALACGGPGSNLPHELSIDDLRARAAARPDSPSALFDLAAGELLRPDGDSAERAGPAIAAARRLRDGAPLALLAGLEAQSHGRPGDARAHYADALRLAAAIPEVERSTVGAQQAFAAAEVAAASLEDLGDHVDTAFWSETIADLAPRLPASVAHIVRRLLQERAYRRGELAEVNEQAAAAGCVTEWRVAGPFGPRVLLGFDEEHPAAGNGPLADEYDLGPRRGVRPTRTVHGHGCTIHLGNGPVMDGGTTYALATIEAPAGPSLLRLETPNAVAVSVDGEEVARLDHRNQPLRRVTYYRLDLSPGRHELRVKVTTRHPNPVLVLALSPGDLAVELDADIENASLFERFLTGALHLIRGRSVDAREAIRGLDTRAPVLATIASSVTFADPFSTPDQRRDRGREILRAAAAHDPQAYLPALQLPRLEAAEGRVAEALAQLREAATRFPQMRTFRLAIANLALSQQWFAEAQQNIEAALGDIGPDAEIHCPSVAAMLNYSRARDWTARARELTDLLIERCDARSAERFSQALSARQWDVAQAELERLSTLEPPESRARLLASLTEVQAGQGDVAALGESLVALNQLRPRFDATRLALADLQLGLGERAEALRTLTDAITAEPAATLELRRTRTFLGGADDFAGFRVDGLAKIREFESSGRTYDAPQVLVFDYMVTRVLADGSALQLVHQIYKAQSEETVDPLGQFTAPDGSNILRLRTIKADGTVLEPDMIAGMGDTITLPNVQVGDYVEQEYVRLLSPPIGLPTGMLGSRFYFASFEIPFHHSEMVTVLPAEMPIAYDPRGVEPPEPVETVENGLRVVRWAVHQRDPVVQEPGSVNAREYLPSVNWGVNAAWGPFLEGLQDLLADRDVRDPAAERLAIAIAGEGSARERAERLYHWVLQNIENGGNVFGVAPVMIADRSGQRARVLHYLYGLAGIRSELLMVRSFAQDQTVSEVADESTYANLLVRVEIDGEVVHLQTGARGAPFGYIAPAYRGQDGMVLLPRRGPERITLPEVDPHVDERHIEIWIDVQDDGAARVEVVETFNGHEAIGIRASLEGIPDAVLEQQLQQGYVASVLPGGQLVELRLSGKDDPTEPVIMRYVVDVPQLAREQEGRRFLPGLFPALIGRRYAAMGARTTTMISAPPMIRRVVVHVRGAQAELPTDVVLAGPEGLSYRTSASAAAGELTLTRELEFPTRRVTPAEYRDYAIFCRSVDEAEVREIELSR